MSARRLPALAQGLVLALALAGSGMAQAQTSLDQPPLDERAAARLDRMEKVVRELRAIVFQGRETGTPVVIQPAETSGQIQSLTDRLNDLDQTLARLNGQMEIIRHDLDQARKEDEDLRIQNAALKDQVGALDQKIAAMAAPPPAPSADQGAPPASGLAGGSPSGPPPGPPADPAAAFSAAKGMFDTGDLVSAEAGFQDYLDRFGDGPRAPEAHYYLGRLLLARHAYGDAATAEIGAIRGWPQTRWASEAALTLSRALVGLGKNADACQALGELAHRYPKASATVRAAAAEVKTQAQCG